MRRKIYRPTLDTTMPGTKKRDKDWSRLSEPERETQRDWGRAQVEAWKAGQEKKASCNECKRKTPEVGNPILLCDGCDNGALHFPCTKKYPLKTIPGEDDEVS